MKDNENIKKAIFLAIGFIIGYAAHAYLTPDVINTTNNDLDSDMEVVTTTADDKKDVETIKNDNVSDGGIASRDTQRFAVEEFDAVSNELSVDGYVVSVNNQSSGSIVYLSELELPEESWVAVREDIDGHLGNILGARKYAAGKTTAVIELIRGTQEKSTYYIVFYTDDGDGEFDHTQDAIRSNQKDRITAVKFLTH